MESKNITHNEMPHASETNDLINMITIVTKSYDGGHMTSIALYYLPIELCNAKKIKNTGLKSFTDFIAKYKKYYETGGLIDALDEFCFPKIQQKLSTLLLQQDVLFYVRDILIKMGCDLTVISKKSLVYSTYMYIWFEFVRALVFGICEFNCNGSRCSCGCNGIPLALKEFWKEFVSSHELPGNINYVDDGISFKGILNTFKIPNTVENTFVTYTNNKEIKCWVKYSKPIYSPMCFTHVEIDDFFLGVFGMCRIFEMVITVINKLDSIS